MNNGQVALALAGGYLLGRTHKMRWALTLAGMAAGSRLRPGAGGVGAQLLKSPELSKLTGTVRDELLSAGKNAAVAAAGSRIDSLSDRMQQRASSLRAGPAEPEEEEAHDEEEEEPRAEEEEEEEEAEEEEEEEEPAEEAKEQDRGRPARKRVPSGTGRSRTPATRPATDKKKTSGSSSKSASRKTASTSQGKSTAAGGSARRGRG